MAGLLQITLPRYASVREAGPRATLDLDRALAFALCAPQGLKVHGRSRHQTPDLRAASHDVNLPLARF
jgi:hypothetical protein